jgi:hypothetical protein
MKVIKMENFSGNTGFFATFPQASSKSAFEEFFGFIA